LAAGGNSILRLPSDGRHGPCDACYQLDRQLAALARALGDLALVPVVCLLRLAYWVRGCAHRLVYLEVGRQPWVVWGLLRTADAMTPTLTGPQVLATLIGYVVVYAFIFTFGARYIYRLLREGPTDEGAKPAMATGHRPMAAAGPAATATGNITPET